ncbi:MAG: hypothetical protein Q7R65_03420 [bacterium]|nr:hypothetical protein [bacterium]
METEAQHIALSEELPDAAYEKMDPKIRPLVRCLNKNGIVTFCSCEGHFERMSTRIPHVFIDIHKTTPTKIIWLIEKLSRFNFSHAQTDVEWTLHPSWSKIYGVSRHGLCLRILKDIPLGGYLLFEVIQRGIKKLYDFLESSEE